jgi:uncharacterized membrane protein YkvA (DUF1232 family)
VSQQSWKPLFRAPKGTVTKVLASPAFLASREQASVIIKDPGALRALADTAEGLEYEDAPLSAIADRVVAALRLLRDRAAEVEAGLDPPAAGRDARVRLILASLHYLITPVDLVPDFRAGGYIDDVLLLSWVFGAASNELEPYLDGIDAELSAEIDP